MAKAGSSKVGTLEILVALGAVVFIFSLVGALDIGKISGDVGLVPQDDVEEAEAVLDSAYTEVVVSPVMAEEPAYSVQEVSGTSLSSGSSGFVVGDSAPSEAAQSVTPTMTGMITAVATAEVS